MITAGNHDATYLERVLEIASVVLQRDDLDGNSDFFDLGGTSLEALHILWKIEERLGVALSLETFFDAPDLRAVAALIGDQND